MRVDSNFVLPEEFASRVTPFFDSPEEFRQTRDNLYSELESELEKLAEKRRRSEEAAQTKRYR